MSQEARMALSRTECQEAWPSPSQFRERVDVFISLPPLDLIQTRLKPVEIFPLAPLGIQADGERRIELLGCKTERQTESPSRAAAGLPCKCTRGFCCTEDTSTALHSAAAAGESLETSPWESGIARHTKSPPAPASCLHPGLSMVMPSSAPQDGSALLSLIDLFAWDGAENDI